MPLLIDELPLFALLAAHARGTSRGPGAEELRHKESDRIEALVDALRALGLRAKSHPDGFEVTGVPRRPGRREIDARGDHRIATTKPTPKRARWPAKLSMSWRPRRRG